MKGEKASLRKAYGDSLVALGKKDNDIVVLEADLGKSTMSIEFGKEFPERYFQMGIAEQDRVSVAAGLALTACDAVETEKMMEALSKGIGGPAYLRINRNDLPLLTDPEEPYQIGKMNMMRDGSDAVVFATGVMVSRSLEAAEELGRKGISVRVVNVSTIKPLSREDLLRYSDGMKAIVTAEEHSIIGGLGGAVCEALSETGKRIGIIGINDEFGRSAAGYEELLDVYGLTATHVCSKVIEMLG